MSVGTTYAGIRVLDLSENIAGPLACMVLADLGADVVKVERDGGGDATRSLPPFTAVGESTVFLAYNRNKRSVVVDLRTTEGVDTVLALARDVDVVVSSYRPGVAEKLGLGFAALTAVSPTVVYATVSAFGYGPVGARTIGYDALLQAFSGMMDVTGEPAGRPVRAAASVIDVTTGMWTAMGVMAALCRRDAGEGAQRVDLAMLDSAMLLMNHQISGLRGAGAVPVRLGAAAPSAAPYDAWPTTTGEIMVAAVTDRHFQRLCAVLGLDRIAADPRFADAEGRVARRDELTPLIGEALARESCEHWLEVISAAGVPVMPVQSLADAVAADVTCERARLTTADDDADVPLLRTPLDDGSVPLRRPPALGADTADLRRTGW